MLGLRTLLFLTLACPAFAADATPTTKTAPLAPLSKTEGDAFLKRMHGTLQTIRTLRCEFVQERHIEFFFDTIVTRGVCYFETPNRLRWEVTHPYASILIHDGKNVAKFQKRDGVWEKMRLGGEEIIRQVLGQITSWMRGDFAQAEKTYTLRVLHAPDRYALELVPRSEKLRETIHAIVLTVDAKTLHVTSVEIRESGDDRVEIRFLRQETNPKFDVELFDLESVLIGE